MFLKFHGEAVVVVIVW